MACYISSNDNRHYVALETAYGTAAPAAAANRIPSTRLDLRQTARPLRRRDKTGSRTFPGLPAGIRRSTAFDVTTYLTHWPVDGEPPCYGALFQAALGAAPLYFAGASVQGVSNDTAVTTQAAHGLSPNQAVRSGGEIRFVAAVNNATSFTLNAPFTTEPAVGSELGATVTYSPSTDLPAVTLHDYWSPSAAVQRLAAGCGVGRMRLQVNGDFHQARFEGQAACLVESVEFTEGAAGLGEFPQEPAVEPYQFPLVPGSLGQAWFGVEQKRFHTLVEAELSLDNDLNLRAEEFGIDKASCVVAGLRTVQLSMRLIAKANEDTKDLYAAARQRAPIGAMFQLGQQARHLCGVYLPAVVPEIPEFEDEETRLEWRFRNCRAQGSGDDEIIIAFA